MSAKKDLLTTIVTAIVGVIFAFIICNLLVPQITPFSIKTVDSSVSTDLAEPDPEVFNYKALNPTVEVYVGQGEEVTSDSGNPSNQGNS